MDDTHFQILARMSPLPVAKSSPVGQGATEMTTIWLVSGSRSGHGLGHTDLNFCALEASDGNRRFQDARIERPYPWIRSEPTYHRE